jgi:hypothetical protein
MNKSKTQPVVTPKTNQPVAKGPQPVGKPGTKVA